MRGGMSGELPDGLHGGVAGEVPDKVSGEVPEDWPDKLRDRSRDELRDEVPGELAMASQGNVGTTRWLGPGMGMGLLVEKRDAPERTFGDVGGEGGEEEAYMGALKRGRGGEVIPDHS